ncbi:type II 3-dehydroquinate dehydratase [Bartonella sp. DGB1]|uniref:type II 3-dehydroquinate dehydratase n=1 Tax=Bartonella sp. DGB1 TaxID=3239807 RepID=UPI003525BA6E
MKQTIFIINGPNLNLLGNRENNIYGDSTLQELQEMCENYIKSSNFNIKFFQSNYEGKLIDLIQQAAEESQGLIINAAGYSHTSVAIYDAVKNYPGFSVEVHLSNIYKREEFRKNSYVSSVVDGVISGLGTHGYILALEYLTAKLTK